ncbi:hypothetical protein ABZP36_035006 [Zizania latifolia]
MSSDDDNDSSCQSLEAFLAEERDFSYLLDILISSSMIVADLQLLCKSRHSPGCPVGPHVFDMLERKYNKIATWPRPERRFLFDLANSVLSEILAPCIDMHPWVKSSRRFSSVWGLEGPVEVVWQTIVKHQEEIVVGHPDYKVLDREWLEVADDINMVGKQIAKMLHAKEIPIPDVYSAIHRSIGRCVFTENPDVSCEIHHTNYRAANPPLFNPPPPPTSLTTRDAVAAAVAVAGVEEEALVGYLVRLAELKGNTASVAALRRGHAAAQVEPKGTIAPATASSPAPHGGRGALPSAGGSPSDLLFLAGGGRLV